MVRANAVNALADTYKQRFVLSWFNRRALQCYSDTATNVSTASATPVELSTTARCEFLTWADDAAVLSAHGFASNSAAGGAYAQSAVGVDGAVFSPSQIWQSGTAN